MPAAPDEPGDDSLVDALEEIASLGVGLGLILFVLFPLAVPVMALALLLALPLVPVALAASLLAAPFVLVRRLSRRAPSGDHRASRRGGGGA